MPLICPALVEIRVEIEGREVFRSAQREFFVKNGHRGRKALQEAVSDFAKSCK
jgi:hypothetical protein